MNAWITGFDHFARPFDGNFRFFHFWHGFGDTDLRNVYMHVQ